MEILNNILTKEECKSFIQCYEDLPKGPHSDRGWNVKTIYGRVSINNNGKQIVEENYNVPIYEVLLYSLPERFRRDVIWVQMTKYSKGEYLTEHTDSHNNQTLNILLSDDFVGGETFISSKEIKWNAGTGILFDGYKEKHRVDKVTSGDRYAITIWFKPFNTTII